MASARVRRALLLCLFLLGAGAQGGHAEDLVIIVNNETVLDAVSIQELSALYLGESTGIRGLNLKPVGYASGNALRAFFDARVLKMTSEQFAEHWRTKRFLGGLQKPPTNFKSILAVKRFVAEERTAVGYVSFADVDASVRMVGKVDEVPVGARNYPLHIAP